MVDEAAALVNQNVSVFGLVPALIHHDLLHGWIVRKLPHLRLVVFVFAAEALLGDLTRIEVLHLCVVELVPVAFAIFGFFTIFDEGVVVSRLRSAVVDDYSLERVLEVIIGHSPSKQDSLVRVQVLHGQVLVVHFLDQVLARDVLLAVRLHVKLHGEAAVVVDFVLLEGVKVEFEALQLKEEYVGQALDRAALQSVSLRFALLAVVGVVSLKHFTFDESLEPLENGLFVLHLERDRHELLLSFAVVRTPLADEFVGEDAKEEVLHDFFLLCPFDQVLDAVDQHVKELVDVTLDHRVDRRPIDVFKGQAEFLRVEVLLLKLLEGAKDAFKLVHDVGVFGLGQGKLILVLNRLLRVLRLVAALFDGLDHRARRLLIFDFEHSLAERCDHKQLLHDTVHVANAANVLQPDVTRRRFLLLVIGGYAPVVGPRCAPKPGHV